MMPVIGAKLSRWTPAYFAVSLAALLSAEALAASGLAYPAAPLAAPGSLIAVHLVTIGWLSLLMLGALHQFLPVIAARPLASDRLALVALALIVAGLAAMIAGFLALGGFGFPVALLPLGGAAVLAGFLSAIANLGWTLRRVSPLPLPARFVIAALGFLALTALLGIAFGCAFALAAPPDWLIALIAQGLALHLLAGIGGWFMLTAMGVGYKLLPMFMLSEEERGRLGTAIFSLVLGGLLLAWGGGFLEIIAGQAWHAAEAAGEVLLVIGVALYLWDMRLLFRQRLRRSLELNSLTAAAALVVFAATFAGLGVLRLAGGGAAGAAPLLLLALIGWLTLLGLGQLYKIVPFLIWLERYAPHLGRAKVPRVQDLVDEKRARPWFAAFALGALAAAAAAALGSVAAAQLAASVLLLATLGITRELLRARRGQPDPAAQTGALSARLHQGRSLS